MPRQVNPETRKAEIAAAALEICRTEGLAALSFRRLAAHMGASSTTPIRHYAKTRADLLALMLSTYFEQIGTLGTALLAGLPPQQGLRLLLENVVPVRAEVRAVARLGLDAAIEINRTGGELGQGLGEWGAWLETTIADLVRRCDSPLGTEVATSMVLSTVTGLSLHSLLDGERWPTERQQATIDALLTAVLPPAAKKRRT